MSRIRSEVQAPYTAALSRESIDARVGRRPRAATRRDVLALVFKACADEDESGVSLARVVTMKTILGIALCACVSACGMPSPAVETTSAVASDFQHYRTYTFDLAKRAPGDFGASDRSVDAQQRAMGMVAEVLAKKGYVNVPSNGDLVVTIAAGEAEVIEIHTNQEALVVPAGSLMIDAYDPVKKQRVWQSVAGAEVHENGIDEGRLRNTVHKMMDQFPAHH
jgi:hypothetical protein